MTEDQSTLSVLETISTSSDIPQRQIAKRTGLNLAKVNFVLRKLKEKGFVKLKRVRDNPNKLRYLYLLTPEGMAEKSRLTYRFLQRTLKQYNQAEGKVQDAVESMIAQGVRRIVLWGNTEITDLCVRIVKSLGDGVHIVGVVDPTGHHTNALHPSQLEALDIDGIFVCQPDADLFEFPQGIPVWRLD